MTFHPPLNKLRLLNYESFYNDIEPKNIKGLEYRAHNLVSRLIHVQFKGIHDHDDISKACRETDDLIRELKVEFNCIYIKLDEHNYPSFIRKLESNKVYAELDEYHYLIINLLKLMLFRIGGSDAKRDIENQFKEIIIELIYKHEPPKKLKPLFKDRKPLFKRVTDSGDVSKADDKTRKLLRELVDIEIDG